MKKILVLHGPNINMTGIREVCVYGKETFEEINNYIIKEAEKKGIFCEIYHSNSEGGIIDKIQRVYEDFDGLVINAGAYSHYSYAIRDAISLTRKPCIEVHFSNIYNREDFRNKSVISPVCVGLIAGFGKQSYTLALKGLLDII